MIKIKFYNPIKKQEIVPKKVKKEDVIGYYLEKAYGIYEIENPSTKEFEGEKVNKCYYCLEPWGTGIFIYELENDIYIENIRQENDFEENVGVYFSGMKIGETETFKKTDISVKKENKDTIIVMCPWEEDNEEFVSKVLGKLPKVTVTIHRQGKEKGEDIDKDPEEFLREEFFDDFIRRVEIDNHSDYKTLVNILNNPKKEDIKLYDFGGVFLMLIKGREDCYLITTKGTCYRVERGLRNNSWDFSYKDGSKVVIKYVVPSLYKGMEYFHVRIFEV